MTRLPSRLVLLGSPVSHSLSPAFQNAALRSLGIPLRYEAIDVAAEELARAMQALAEEGAAGNVTVPHKEAALRLCARRTPLAERVGAVNTFWVDDDGLLVGDNTDVDGFAALAAAAMSAPMRGARVALLGAGGAAAAVLAALEQWEGCAVVLHNRTRPRAEAAAARFPVVAHIADSAEDAVLGADVVVNATSVGMRSADVPVRVEALRAGAVVLDLVYRRGGTAWVRRAREAGHAAADGLPMLVEQGAVAFERWLGVPAPRDVMRAAVA